MPMSADLVPVAPSAAPVRGSSAPTLDTRLRELSAEVNRRLAALGVPAVAEFRPTAAGAEEVVVRTFGTGAAAGPVEVTAVTHVEGAANEAWIAGVVAQIAARVAGLVPVPDAAHGGARGGQGPYWCVPD